MVIQLGHGALYFINTCEATVSTLFPSGKACTGQATFTQLDVERARALGYKEEDDLDVAWAMHRDHDLIHHLVGQSLGLNWSDVLFRLAHGLAMLPGEAEREECLVFLVTRAMNEGRYILTQTAAVKENAPAQPIPQ